MNFVKTVPKPRDPKNQAGYSLLLVVFMVATLLIATGAATQSILVQGRREREQETVWRGEQYQRAIGLYFRKFGRYPTKIDDLTKQTNGVRFLRQAYTDPLNKVDGKWRFIYVGPNGQLIGSVRRVSLLQGVLGGAITPGAGPGGPATAQPPASGFGTSANTAPGSGGPASNGIGTGTGTADGASGNTNLTTGGAPSSASGGSAGAGVSGSGTGSGAQSGSAFSLSSNPLQSQPQPLSGAVIGGNIIGVGSKVKQSSLRVYQGADTYDHWEFIWNPTPQIAILGSGQAPPSAPPLPVQQNQPPQGQTAVPVPPPDTAPQNAPPPQPPAATPQPPATPQPLVTPPGGTPGANPPPGPGNPQAVPNPPTPSSPGA